MIIYNSWQTSGIYPAKYFVYVTDDKKFYEIHGTINDQ